MHKSANREYSQLSQARAESSLSCITYMGHVLSCDLHVSAVSLAVFTSKLQRRVILAPCRSPRRSGWWDRRFDPEIDLIDAACSPRLTATQADGLAQSAALLYGLAVFAEGCACR